MENANTIENWLIINTVTSFIVICISLGYTYFMNSLHRKEVKELNDRLKQSELQLNDKLCVIKELQTQVEKPT